LLLRRKVSMLSLKPTKALFCIPLFLLCVVIPALAQKTEQKDSSCPKPFQEEMGISFSKGDEIAVTGSKVKQDTSDVILARELVKGTDTLMFRDDKGNPVWDSRTGK
jgi:hypothetical protein